MKSKYIPSQLAGKKVDLEGRMTAIVSGSLLLATGPIYLAREAVGKIREYLTGRKYKPCCSGLDEFTDTLKWCYSAAVKGRFPGKEGRG